MEIPQFLAMTAAELRSTEAIPTHIAWMACHFSSYGTGISNIPRSLPKGAMLMLNDRTPICGHDPELVAKTLCQAADVLECGSILLDFQREDCQELFDVVRAVLERTNCSVGVSAPYAEGFDCPLLVPPILPHVSPEKALAHWQGRELWLELSREGTQIEVTSEGSQYTSLDRYIPEKTAHHEPELHCHYEITAEEERVLFQLGRTAEDQSSLLEAAKALGVTHGVGLWQELRC